jgi:hypothetical protein
MSSHVTKAELTASIGTAPLCDQFDIFSLPPASRRDDPETSKAAGAIFERRGLSEFHERVLAAFRINGPMTDEVLERLPVFASLAPSTARKRRSELYQLGRLVIHGLVTNSRGVPMTIWAIREGA